MVVVRKVIIVSVHVHYFSFFSVFSVYVSHATSGFVRLCQIKSVYVGGMGCGAQQYPTILIICDDYHICSTCHWILLIKTIQQNSMSINAMMTNYLIMTNDDWRQWPMMTLDESWWLIWLPFGLWWQPHVSKVVKLLSQLKKWRKCYLMFPS